MAKDNPITKLTRRFFERKNLMPDRHGNTPNNKVAWKDWEENTKLLEQCALMYASLASMRQERQINYDYFNGKQFNELIPNPNGCGSITEFKYIVDQGYIPLSINIILPKIKAIVGVYCDNAMEPYVVSRVREEQKLGELLTTTLNYAVNAKNIQRMYVDGYTEFNISAIPCFRTGYGWDKERKIQEVYAELMNVNDMFWDFNNNDSFFEHIHTIGCLHDMTLAEVLSEYAKSDTMAQKIMAAYQDVEWQCPEAPEQFSDEHRDVFKSFFEPMHAGQCRVIEVWREESHAVYPCWDTGKGESFTLPCTAESKAWIESENNRRIMEVVEAGGYAENASLIEVGYVDEQTGEHVEYRVDTDWVVRYMTPQGYVLKTEVSPYLHGSHPFVIGGFPLLNGEIHSNVSDLRNSQRMINRLLSSAEYERMNRAKGAVWVNQEVLDRSNVSIDDFAKVYTNPKGVIGLRIKDGEKVYERMADHTGNADDNSKLEFYMNIANEVSGAHGSLRGERPTAGTPAALYAQETQNANNNIANGMEWYNALINRLNNKLMMLQLQYYDKRRFIEIAGSEYTHEIEYIINTPARQRQTLFDLQLIKSPQAGFAKIQREQMLQSLYEAGAIPAQIWLKNTTLNGADKILEDVEQYQQEQAEAQQNAAALQQAQQGGLPPAAANVSPGLPIV